jgi:hypothetical protein
MVGLKQVENVEIKKRMPANWTANEDFNYINPRMRLKAQLSAVLCDQLMSELKAAPLAPVEPVRASPLAYEYLLLADADIGRTRGAGSASVTRCAGSASVTRCAGSASVTRCARARPSNCETGFREQDASTG